jgi:hypothetical protein
MNRSPDEVTQLLPLEVRSEFLALIQIALLHSSVGMDISRELSVTRTG